MAKHKNSVGSGISGWLLLITIIFIISGIIALSHLIETIFLFATNLSVYAHASINSTALSTLAFTIVLLLIACFFIIYSIVLILEKKKKAVKVSIIALWASFIFNIWAVVISNLVFSFKEIFVKGSSSIELPCMIVFAIATLIITVAWTSYFLKSRRVKNTLVK